jgi:hypothetical protein
MQDASYWQDEYKQLLHELQQDDYQELLTGLKQTWRFLGRFGTWANVVAFMRAGTSDDPQKDKVLRPILRAHQQDGDHRWRTILLVIFWPGLRSLFWQKAHWDPNHRERWGRVVWTFLEVVCRLDPRRRSRRLVQKLINDTVHHLHRAYRRDWDETEFAPPMDPDLLEALAGGVEHVDFAIIDERDAQEAEIKRLRAHVDAGRISEADFLLLVGTRVYGQPLADYVREHGLNYEAAKKRRLRAEAAIRRPERNRGK